MGTIYYGACHDCKVQINLDKFYSWYGYESELNQIDKETLDDFKSDGFIYRTLRLHYFIGKHQGHRLGVYTEHDDLNYKEVYPWPIVKEGAVDEIDFTDPKASRLIVKTKHGDIFLDIRPDGVNCFRFVGNRLDTLLLPAKKKQE